ncbi:MAG TPA: molybdopterin converting factor subunit 1 [Marinagarivorans sp.]
MTSIKLCFFAALSETLGVREETYPVETPTTLSALKKNLAQRGQHWQALTDASILCAINHDMAKGDPEINNGDEVAFFPPVTGG